MKERKKPYPRRLLRVLMALCAVGILVSALVLLSDGREYAKGDDAYRQVRLIRKPAEPPAAQANPPQGSLDQTPAEDAEEQPVYRVDFAALEEINRDVVGWLAAEGTEIDYPVVQGEDNDFYLGHLFTGERNRLGAIFMDYRNRSDFSDKNTVVYGHNMRDGSMFSSLTKYKDQSHYDAFPTMLLYTPSGDFEIWWFAGAVVDGNYASVRTDFKDDRDFLDYVDALKQSSTFESSAAVTAGDRIVTLYTCSYEFKNAGYALYGNLVPLKRSAEDESP